nr:hypothetical protein [Tanacetum cinerariifolium]
MVTRPSQDYILMPLWNDGSLFDFSPKASDGDNKDNDGPNTESEIDNQERPNAEHSTKDINTVGPSINTVRPSINTASSNFNTASPTVNAVRLSDDFFDADNDMRSLDGVELDISNISTPYSVLTTPNTRINKDHSLNNVIGDIQSGVQTRRMTVTTDEQGFISAIYEEKTYEDLHTCLFAYFLSQEESKRITNALKDPTWVEAMQEELMQFHLQTVWTLVDFPRDWLLKGVLKKKALPMMKSLPLIEEEVYVRQPPRFEDTDYPDKVYKVEKALYGLHQALRTWVQVKQKSDGIFISQYKYVDKILRKFKYDDVKPAITLMDKEKALLKDLDGDVHLYRSMIGSLMYLTSSRLDIMIACKKQTVVATSTTEAEYVTAASCCDQFWYTASARTLDNREIELNATVDGQVKTITEASVMRHLKLADADDTRLNTSHKRIYIAPSLTQKVFSNMKRESRGFFRVETTLFPTMLVTEQVSQGGGPTSPVGTQHTYTIVESSPHLQNISITYRKTRTRTGRMGIRIPQSNVPSSAADEAITKEMHDGLGRATTTAFSLAVEQSSGNKSKTQTKATPSGLSSPRTSLEGGPGCHFTIGDSPVQARPERLSNLPNKPPLGEVTHLENELTSTKAVYNKASITLTKRVKKLEKKLKHKRRRAVFDSSEEEETSLDHEDSPKQERMIEEINKDKNVNLVKSTRLAQENIAQAEQWDDVQAQIHADEVLAKKC